MSKTTPHMRLLLTGGGTGGHLFPALAAAQEMCLRIPGTKVLFVGTKRKMDQTSLANTGYTVKSIYCYGIKGKSLLHLIKAIAVLPVSLIQAAINIIIFKPDVVLGVGGYVTGPVMVAAKLLGKRTIIHEQNSVPGLANRKLGRMADCICISLPQSSVYFPSERTIYTGNPVRKAILDLAEQESTVDTKEKITLLVLGGSQGAHRVNELVVEALCQYGAWDDLRVIHQTGSSDVIMVREQYEEKGIECRVEPFFCNMAEIYAEADLLVSRAGATTLAELAVLGKPALLIPYPFAADNHQQKNAEYYADGGGCMMLLEDGLTGERLAEQLKELLSDSKLRLAMAEKMRKLGQPQAASSIVDVCIGKKVLDSGSKG